MWLEAVTVLYKAIQHLQGSGSRHFGLSAARALEPILLAALSHPVVYRTCRPDFRKVLSVVFRQLCV